MTVKENGPASEPGRAFLLACVGSRRKKLDASILSCHVRSLSRWEPAVTYLTAKRGPKRSPFHAASSPLRTAGLRGHA